MDLNDNQVKVFLDRYALKSDDGEPLESSIQQVWHRVASAVGEGERESSDRALWGTRFYEILSDFSYVPGGRILAAMGSRSNATANNCYVIPSPEDSRHGILRSLQEWIDIQAMGGGVGINLSTLRPRGSRVKTVNGTSSGPVVWAEMFSHATHKVIQQGGCFAGETRVTTDKGLLTIKEIVDGRIEANAWTHRGWKPITSWFNNGVKRTLRVRTKSGHEMVATPNHKFLTLDEEFRPVFVALEDLRPGDQILLGLGGDDMAPYPTQEWNGYEIDEDFAYLLGFFHGNGYYFDHTVRDSGSSGIQLSISQKRPDTLARLQRIIENTFGREPKTYDGDGACWNILLHSVDLVNQIKQSPDVWKKSAKGAFVPDIIMRSPARVRAAFLGGLFDSDGSNKGSKGGLTIGTVSEQMAKDLPILLLSLGIPSITSVDTKRVKEQGWNALYNISVGGKTYQQRYAGWIEKWTSKIRDRPLSNVENSFKWPNMYPLWSGYGSAHIGRGKYGRKGGTRAPLATLERVLPRNNVTMTRKAVDYLADHMDAFTDEHQDLVHLLLNTVPVDIESIEEADTVPTYDIEVADTHTFVANGGYVSNSRRGAAMIMLNDDHPDLEEFIDAKRTPGVLEGANLSVCVSNAFMEAVRSDGTWDLKWQGEVWKTVRARDIWDKIVEAAWASAEPGVYFLERANDWANSGYFETLTSTNPCGEQPLGPYGACLLGSFNLTQYLAERPLYGTVNSTATQTVFDFQKFRRHVSYAVRFNDNIIDLAKYPLPECRESQQQIRRMGMGVMGLADVLIRLGYRYGSASAISFTAQIYQELKEAAYEASALLAAERGPFPKYDAAQYLKRPFIQGLSQPTRDLIEKHGIRNCYLTTQAPTGTTAMLAGVNSGIEPYFDFRVRRNDRLGERYILSPWAKFVYADEGYGDRLPDVRPEFVTANEVSPEEHVLMQAAAQRHVDSSISKTSNMPNSATVADVHDLYMKAWEMGLKSLTVYRDGSRQEQVLYHVETEAPQTETSEAVLEVPEQPPLAVSPPVGSPPPFLRTALPDERPTIAHKFVVGEHEGYLHIGLYENGQPGEIFIRMSKEGSTLLGILDSWAMLFSYNLQQGAPLERICEKLIGTRYDPAGFTANPDIPTASSITDYIGRYMLKRFGTKATLAERLGLGEPVPIEKAAEDHQQADASADYRENIVTTGIRTGDFCPSCGVEMFRAEGCMTCPACFWSKC